MSLINYKDAIDLIQTTNINIIDTEMVPINSCVNRVLGDDILAIEDMPNCDTSSMDGYAFCFEDTKILLTEGLDITSINKAGNKIIQKIKKGGCIKTFTGSKMPDNTDTLVLVEQVIVKNNKIFLLENEKVEKDTWVRKKAQNYKKNEILIKKGTLISPFHIGILAQNNYSLIEVFRKPRLSILSSGDEIVEVGSKKYEENTIYSSNNHIISALAQSLGAEVSIHKILKDNKDEIKSKIKQAMLHSDMIVTTGGMSKGDFDFIKDILKTLGNIVFDGINIKPGKVTAYINYEGHKHLLGLPGNPLSSVISFLLFGRLILQRMLNIKINIPIYKAHLLSNIISNNNKTEFILAKINIDNGVYKAMPIQSQSYMINNFKEALIISKGNMQRGDFVDIILLNDLIKLQ